VEAAKRHLARATLVALERVAADRDSEQAAWARHRAALREELEDDGAPDVTLLRTAQQALQYDCSSDVACGIGLLIEAALQWREGCGPPSSCIGSVDAMTAAARFGEINADTWKVIAAKEALDTMDAGHDTVMFPQAISSLTEALSGHDLPLHLLRRKNADPAVWLAVGRAINIDGMTTWSDVRPALGSFLEETAQRALENEPPPEQRTLLMRIAARAVP